MDPIIDIIHENQIDWMHACGKKGRCTTCKMVVVEGQEHLPELTEAELKFKESNQLGDNERLACQIALAGDIVIRVHDRYKFPHITYSE